MTATDTLALIDIGPLLDPQPDPDAVAPVVRQIDAACRALGFFRVTGHGIGPQLMAALDAEARAFFAQPDDVKAAIAMAKAGPAWRGWFPVRGEVTSGRPDRKEGLYVGTNLGPHPRVAAGTPLHGANLYPPGALGPAIDAWIAALGPVADAVMRGIARALGLLRPVVGRRGGATPPRRIATGRRRRPSLGRRQPARLGRHLRRLPHRQGVASVPGSLRHRYTSLTEIALARSRPDRVRTQRPARSTSRPSAASWAASPGVNASWGTSSRMRSWSSSDSN